MYEDILAYPQSYSCRCTDHYYAQISYIIYIVVNIKVMSSLVKFICFTNVTVCLQNTTLQQYTKY